MEVQLIPETVSLILFGQYIVFHLPGSLPRMILRGKKELGVELKMENFCNMREDYALFSESIGYVIEVKKDKEEKLRELYGEYGIKLIPIGKTMGKTFSAWPKGKKLFEISIHKLKKTWLSVQSKRLLR